ncbi:NAD(P)-dependent methylenetetrahydromethanopterin dehydrogenase [Azospirillum halopraeferens]|uniref:NAD(P)-dependent methylenetetrahydromethanopterin dehydrogenase n=1 Tax=Azospirillum halopraeferens TaxID=34010 RepID=UPI000413D5E6|nr:NAD(P)-dependent methylenetetrahydromethanopterin dehydrogenase [Azospirillum halopraeferens]
MNTPSILHALTPLPHMSPFDVNMAYDAGFDAVTPYTGLTLDEVTAFTQDVIFSRAPENGRRTGIFIGGRDAGLAVDMLERARAAMQPPFEVSVFADPSGAFTTAAAMVAVVEKHLKAGGRGGLAGQRVAVFGATGVVGGVAAVIAAQAGAAVTLVAHRAGSGLEEKAAELRRRFGVETAVTGGGDDDAKVAVLRASDVALCAARAGVQVLSAAVLAAAPELAVVADVNAVPPAGAEGVSPFDDGTPVAGGRTAGVGALAVGNVKFMVQHHLLQRMLEADSRQYLSFGDAFAHARTLVA